MEQKGLVRPDLDMSLTAEVRRDYIIGQLAVTMEHCLEAQQHDTAAFNMYSPQIYSLVKVQQEIKEDVDSRHQSFLQRVAHDVGEFLLRL